MLHALKFISGVVSEKGIAAELTHVKIADGRIVATNGLVTLNSPIGVDLNITPKAIPFLKAISKCNGDSISLDVTKAGRLAVRSSKFRAFIDCLPPDSEAAYPEPSGEFIVPGAELVPIFKVLTPLCSKDASRPWSRGLLMKEKSCFATNNIILCEYWVGGDTFECPVNIPVDALREAVRIGEEPTTIQHTERSITFHYDGGAWLHSRLYDAQWPDVSKLLDKPMTERFTGVDELSEALGAVSDFTGVTRYVCIGDGKVYTTEDTDAGASADVIGLSAPERTGCNVDQLSLVCSVADSIDFSVFPEPIRWRGKNIRGVIAGMKNNAS